MARLVANVSVRGVWYGPDYPAAGDPPVGSVSNPAAWEGGVAPSLPADPEPSVTPATGDGGQSSDPIGGDGSGGDVTPRPGAPVPPPTAGPGSSVDRWRHYAAELEVHVDRHASRADIIAAVAGAGFPVE